MQILKIKLPISRLATFTLYKIYTKNIFKNSNDSDTTLPVFPLRTNLKLHNVSATPKSVKKVITNLNLLKTFAPGCIPGPYTGIEFGNS